MTVTIIRAANKQDDQNPDSKALAAIERFISEPPENSRVFTITPAMAEILIARYNIENRPVKSTKIREYADAMQNEKWGLTGDTLKFSNLRRLRDGQNRLYACIKAGAPFRTHIVFGIEDSLFAIMDRGKNRDGGDVLAIQGVAYPRIVSQAVRWSELLDTNTVKLRTVFQPVDISELYRTKHAGVADFVAMAKKTDQPHGMMAALLFHFSKKSPQLAQSFGDAWGSGQRQGPFKVINRAQKRLSEVHEASFGRVNDVVRAATIVKAWNLFRENRIGTSTGKPLAWDASEPFPTIK